VPLTGFDEFVDIVGNAFWHTLVMTKPVLKISAYGHDRRSNF
jgi:hypothetical protein